MPMQQRPTQPTACAAAASSTDWSRLVAEALKQAVDAAADETTLFHCAFPLGEAIGEVFRRRAASGKRPLGLVDLVGELALDGGAEITAQARRALLAGLCWNLEEAVGVGSRLTRELGGLPETDPLDAARERAQAIAGELRRRQR
jgi:hypothetical protein